MSVAAGAAIGAVVLGAWQYTREAAEERACRERAAQPGNSELCLYFPGSAALTGAMVGAAIGAAIGWGVAR